jgi:hypothetical protein
MSGLIGYPDFGSPSGAKVVGHLLRNDLAVSGLLRDMLLVGVYNGQFAVVEGVKVRFI